MNSLSYRWNDPASAVMTGVPRKKIALHPFFPQWLKKTAVSTVWLCTVALLTTQSISRIPFPNDGQVREISPSHLSNEPRLNNQNMFWINGVVNAAEEEEIVDYISAMSSNPVKLISNGSLCQEKDGNCSKITDYLKAFLNRFGNQVTGRGNEPIIEAMKTVLRENLKQDLPTLQLVTYSEGGLIAHAAISDLNQEGNVALHKMTVVLLGTPLHHDKIAELEAIVGKVLVLNNPYDPVTCLQQDVFNQSSWFGTDSTIQDCLMNGDLREHEITLYLNQFRSTVENS